LKPTKNTLSYVKALPTPTEEMNLLGYTDMSMFLTAYSSIYFHAVCETVNHLIKSYGVYSQKDGKWINKYSFEKSKWNTYLQNKYNIAKRHAAGIIADAQGKVSSATECKKEHIKTLKQKLKSAENWLKRKTKIIKQTNKFYNKTKKLKGKNRPIWQNAKQSCRMPLSSSIKYRKTNLNNLRFQVHNKKRYVNHLKVKIQQLKTTPVEVKVPPGQVFVVGSKDEKHGNSVCQWDGEYLTFRVPYCLESRFGKYITTKLGDFKRNINRIPDDGARTWHFYQKSGKWNACLQFTPREIEPVSLFKSYGVISLDLNSGSVDWCELDHDGNLVKHGQIKLVQGLPNGRNKAQLTSVALTVVKLAIESKKPIVFEKLNFSKKKALMREEGTKYNRMLSAWSYSQFFKFLKAISTNRGIECISVTPQYTSLIGLVKYMKMYGLNSGVAAAIAIGRRGMRKSERLPRAIKTTLSVKDRVHLWNGYYKLNKLLKANYGYYLRHHFYSNCSYPNWTCKVKPIIESVAVSQSTE